MSQPPAQPSSERRRLPQMMLCLSAHRDVQFALMQLLELKDLAQLDASCRTWREWLKHPPLLDGLRFTANGPWSRLQAVMQSSWAPRLITSVEQKMVDDSGQLRFSPGSLKEQQAQSELMLRTLPRCTRLRKLVMNIREVKPAALHACFSGVAHSLRTLKVETAGSDAQLLRQLLRRLRPLHALETLEVIGYSVSSALDFSALPLLPRLSKLILKRAEVTRGRIMNVHPWQCSAEQVQCLVQCRSVTSIDCACWSPDPRRFDEFGRRPPPLDKQIAWQIGALVKGRLDAPVASSSSSSEASEPPFATLTRLNLQSTILSPPVWSHVSRLTALKEVIPIGWTADMKAADWAPLARFTQLQHFFAPPHPWSGWLDSDHLIPPLLSCTKLTSLALARMDVRREQLHAICTTLPLCIFSLMSAHVQDCAPLALSSTLHQLIIDESSGEAGVPVQFRSVLPALAHVTELRIFESQAEMLTESEAAPLNAALMARMPKLTLDNFKHNLLADDEDDIPYDEEFEQQAELPGAVLVELSF